MIYKKYENNNYNLYTIKTDKFKGCQMQIVFKTKLEKENITEKNILIDVLMHTSKKYNKRKLFVEKLEDLYAANLYGINSRVGKTLFTTFILDFLDPKYCDKNYLEEVIKLPFEMILNPNVKNESFDFNTFKIMKNRLSADIISLKDEPLKYAIRRSLENMDPDSVLAYQMSGYLEDLDELTEEDLYLYYKEFMKNCICDIYVIGNLDMEYVNRVINEVFRNRYIKQEIDDYYVDTKERKKVLNVVEKGKYEQSSLILLYNTVNLTEREKNFTIHLFNYIFGNGSLTTKLCKYLREENSLCYNTYSIYQKLDNLLMVYAGINGDDKDKCIKLINKALSEMIKGDFSEEDLCYGKKSLVNTIKTSSDVASSLLDNYLFHNVVGTPLLKDRIKEINTVTKEEIVKLASKIKLNTIYMLGSDK